MTAQRLERTCCVAAANNLLANIQIISDVRFFREGLARTLEDEGIFKLSGCFSDLDEAISSAAVARPDAILLDAAFAGGLAAAKRIRAAVTSSRVIALALTETPEQVIAWAEAGAAGYIPRTASLKELVERLLAILQGKQTCAENVASALLERLAADRVRGALVFEATPNLTSREVQIVEMIVSGMTNKDISRRLGIGLATTKTHVHHLLGKLNLQRRGQAACWMRERETLCDRGSNARAAPPIDR